MKPVFNVAVSILSLISCSLSALPKAVFVSQLTV